MYEEKKVKMKKKMKINGGIIMAGVSIMTVGIVNAHR